jgi:hypothetical protein
MTPTAATLVEEERYRQRNIKGYTPAHDLTHESGELSQAACCYVVCASAQIRGSRKEEWTAETFENMADCIDWPFAKKEWKPSGDPVRNLVKAAALLGAEIDRILFVRSHPPEIGSGRSLV